MKRISGLAEGHEASTSAGLFGLIKTVSTQPAVEVWDVETGELSSTLLGHSDDYLFATIGTNRIATTGIYRTVKVWDAATGQELISLEGAARIEGGRVQSRWSPACRRRCWRH